MVIRRDGPDPAIGLMKNVMRCGACRKLSVVLMIRPSDQKAVCKECAGSKWSGFEVTERATTPDAD